MALVLSLKEGQDFYVGDEQFVVDRVDGESQFTLIRTEDGRRFAITDEASSEVAEDVFVSAGDRSPALLARVSIEAPPDILILRGDKRRQQMQGRFRGGRM